MTDNFDTIFEQLDARFKTDTSASPDFIVYEGRIYCGYKPKMNCYVFYRKDDQDRLLSLVYVTDQYRAQTEDLKSLIGTILTYLDSKENMQVTFKTSGIDEFPLETQ